MNMILEAMAELEEEVKDRAIVKLEKSINWHKTKARKYGSLNPRGGPFMNDDSIDNMRRMTDGEEVENSTPVERQHVYRRFAESAGELMAIIRAAEQDEEAA